MTARTSGAVGNLRVVEGALRDIPTRRLGALAQFFDIGHCVLSHLSADIRVGRFRERAFLLGGAEGFGLDGDMARLAEVVDRDYPIELHAPFEGTDSIAGALWSGRELFDTFREDGLAKLRFDRGTLDLPLHVHEFSDRFIIVLAGQGRFHWSNESLNEFAGVGVRDVGVSAGDVLLFTRGLLHTFSAPVEDLLLLSYHSPEIPFDDPRQYTIPPVRWTPRDVNVAA